MRVALTGGSTGIGAAVVQKLHEAGHQVTVFDIAEPNSPVEQWINADLSDPTLIQDAISQANGTFDALINNAGLPPHEKD